MQAKYREALSTLETQIKFTVHEISATDMYYSDGDDRVRKSMFKLVFSHENDRISAIVYIYPHGWWVSWGTLTDKESLAIHDWIDELANRSELSS